MTIPLSKATFTSSHMYLVRHGQSTHNAGEVNGCPLVQGQSPHLLLSKYGEQQVAALATQLCDHIPSGASIVICSSTAIRAQHTAQILFNTLKNSPRFTCEQGESYEGILEASCGDWEGKPQDAAWKSASADWKALSPAARLNTPLGPGGESPVTVLNRALPTLQEITEVHKNKMIFVVSHVGTMQSLHLRWTGDLSKILSTPSITTLHPHKFDNCDLMSVEITGNLDDILPVQHLTYEKPLPPPSIFAN